MGHIVICSFRPKSGKEQELLGVVRDHLPVLRSQGLVTDREAVAMRASDGTIVEVFEWKSKAAVDEAHRNPEVGRLWARYEACSTYVTLRDVAGTDQPFPHFDPID